MVVSNKEDYTCKYQIGNETREEIHIFNYLGHIITPGGKTEIRDLCKNGNCRKQDLANVQGANFQKKCH